MKKRAKKRRRTRQPRTFHPLATLFADPVAPMSAATQRDIMLQARLALRALEAGAQPRPVDWQHLADAINIMDTVISQGHAQDADGLLPDATQAMADAARRWGAGQPLRMSGTGIQQDVTDVQPRPVATYAQIADRMHKAQTIDQLNEAADLIGAIADEQQRAELTQIFNDRASLREGVEA